MRKCLILFLMLPGAENAVYYVASQIENDLMHLRSNNIEFNPTLQEESKATGLANELNSG